MVAPPIKAPEATTASQAPPAHASHPLQQRPMRPGFGSAEQLLALQRTIGNQAVLGLVATERQNLPASTPADGQSHTADPDRVGSRASVQRPSWDFSKIPLFAPDRPSGPEARPTLLQRKLAVGQVDDPLEHEADRIADQVTRTTPASTAVGGSPLRIQRISGQSNRELDTPPASVHQALASPGSPLAPESRQEMEQRFRHDFSRVKVHAGAVAEQSARDMNARAYTVGSDIVLGAAHSSVETQEGRRLLAHELTHVVQQSASTSSPVAIQRDADKDLTADRVRDLQEYVASHPSPYKHVIQVIRFSQKQDLDDNVAADFVESLSAAQLEHFASTPEGREMLDVLYNAMMTGKVTSYETLQADKIVYAKWKFSPVEAFKVAQLSDPDAAPSPIVLIARKRADELDHLAASKRYRDVIAGVRKDSSIEDDIAARFLTFQHPDRLEAYAATDEGWEMLSVLYDALITGDVTEFERLQADRILAAKAKTVRAPAAADIAKAVFEPAIFPLETSWGSTATIRAELLPNAKVKVYYDSKTGLRGKEFARERASLYARYGDTIYSGIILEADEPVIVKLFDQGGSLVTVPAIKLIDFFNQQKEDTLGKIKTVSVMGATVGVGGIGAGGILGWADTIAFAINAGTLFINANRDVIAKTAFGRDFLEAWDLAEGVVEYYNWGRLGVDGLKLVHAKVSVPFKQWRQEVAAGLTSAERNTIAKAQQEAAEWLDALKKAEAAEAAKAAKPAAADSPANAAPRGSQSRTGYSQTPPTSEEDIAAAAGKTRRRPGIDRGKVARPFNAKPTVNPKMTRASKRASKGGGTKMSGSRTKRETYEEYRQRGGTVTEGKLGESGLKDQPKPKPEITARPKERSFEEQREELMGPAEDSPEVAANQSDRKSPGGAQPPVRTEVGNFAHNKLPGYLDEMRAQLARTKSPAARAALKQQIAELEAMTEWPAGLEPNRLSFRMSDGRRGIPDGIDVKTGKVYELKPDTKSEWAKGGEYQASEYAAKLNEMRYAGRTDWQGEVIVYKATEMTAQLREWGVLPPLPPPKTK